MQVVDEVPVGSTGDGPYAVVSTPDGVLWTSFPFSGRVARMEGTRVEHLDAGDPGARPSLLAVDPGGTGVWVTRTGDQRVSLLGRRGVVRDVVLPAGTDPFVIARAGEDLLVAGLSGRLLRIRDGEVVAVAELPAGSFPGAVTVDAAGAAWCTLNQADALARWTGDGAVTLHGTGPGSAPVGIAADATGGIWWTEMGAGRVGHRTASGETWTVELPGSAPRPHAVADDGHGGCFVTAWGSGSLLHLDRDRTVTALELGPASEPHGLTVVADGSVWVALESGVLAHVA